MLGEFGVLERKPGEKEQWFRQAHDWIAAHPAIAAVVYFNADSTDQRHLLRLAGRYVAGGLRGLPLPLHRPGAGTAVALRRRRRRPRRCPTRPGGVPADDSPAPVTAPKPAKARPGTTPAASADRCGGRRAAGPSTAADRRRRGLRRPA